MLFGRVESISEAGTGIVRWSNGERNLMHTSRLRYVPRVGAWELPFGTLAYDLGMYGYFDESEGEDIFCLACVFGPSHHWPQFDEAWASILREENIGNEFHAVDCEHHQGAFESWTDPTERSRVHRRFLEAIVETSPVTPAGLVIGIDLKAYRARNLPQKPWLTAFEHLMSEFLKTQLDANTRVGAIRNMTAIFDEKREFQGRALNMIRSAKTSGPNSEVIGEVLFEDSSKYPGLQAADALAFEVRKSLAAVFKKGIAPRDDWTILQSAVLPSGQRRIWAEYFDDQSKEFQGLEGWTDPQAGER